VWIFYSSRFFSGKQCDIFERNSGIDVVDQAAVQADFIGDKLAATLESIL
jgi:hypothetical protein